MSRTSRFLGGASLGVANMVVASIGGLWLTRFYLHWLGQQQLGYWLIAAQIISYLILVDFGVVALLPRQTALAVGGAGGWQQARELPNLVGAITRVVLWQIPILAVAMVGVWAWLPDKWAPVREPLALVFVAFVVLFPLRIPAAVLQGLQDLAFLGAVQLVSWVTNAALTVALLLAGYRLSAFAIAYVSSQALSAGLALFRLLRKYPGVLPRRLPPVDRALMKNHLRRGGWVSVSQVGTILLSGSDMLLAGSVLGPSSVVLYSCTSRLISVLSNQPLVFLYSASAGLSELRTSAHHRFAGVSGTLGLAVMLASGLIGVAVIGANEAFVGWWVGAAQYGGLAFSFAFVVQVLLRHVATTVGMSIFVLGNERNLAVIGLVEGLAKIGLSALLLRWVGLIGLPLGSIAAMLIVTMPASLVLLSRGTGTSLWSYPRVLAPFAIRFAPVAGLAALLSTRIGIGFLPAFLGATASALLYGLLAAPLAFRDPLGRYVRPRLAPLLRRAGLERWAERCAGVEVLRGHGEGAP